MNGLNCLSWLRNSRVENNCRTQLDLRAQFSREAQRGGLYEHACLQLCMQAFFQALASYFCRSCGPIKESKPAAAESASPPPTPAPPTPAPSPEPAPESSPPLAPEAPQAPQGDGGAGNAAESPLAFDLDGDGIRTRANRVAFDIDGDGAIDHIHDAADGVLSIRGGKDGRDLFGNHTDLDGDGRADGYRDGFEALRALSLKAGVIDPASGDLKLDAKDLELLEQRYGLAMKNGYRGAGHSLRSLGVEEIDLSDKKPVRWANFDGRGNDLTIQEGADFVHAGVRKQYADIWHHK